MNDVADIAVPNGDDVISQFPADFTITFQETIIYCLLTDPKFCNSISEILDYRYFSTIYLQKLTMHIMSYKTKYHVVPSRKILESYIKKNHSNDQRLLKEMINILCRVFDEPTYQSGAEYVKEHVSNFCKIQKLDQALIKTHNMIHRSQHINFDQARRIVQDGFSSTSDKTLTDYKEAFEDRIQAVTHDVLRIPTGLVEIDNDVLKGGKYGGIPVKKYGIVMTFTSGGKTHLLVHLGAAALRHGHTVLHLSLEDDINDVSLRYDSNLSGFTREQILYNKECQREMKNVLESVPGKLYIKEYPGKSCTVLTIRNHIEKLMEDGEKPDVVLLDYIAEMKSLEKEERRIQLEDISREFRAIAVEYELVLWTAAQSQRGTVRKKIVKLDQIGEAYGITHPCDFMLTIGQTTRDSENNECKLFVAKNKIGKDLQVYVTDFSKELSRFRIKDKLDASVLDLDNIGFNIQDL